MRWQTCDISKSRSRTVEVQDMYCGQVLRTPYRRSPQKVGSSKGRSGGPSLPPPTRHRAGSTRLFSAVLDKLPGGPCQCPTPGQIVIFCCARDPTRMKRGGGLTAACWCWSEMGWQAKPAQPLSDGTPSRHPWLPSPGLRTLSLAHSGGLPRGEGRLSGRDRMQLAWVEGPDSFPCLSLCACRTPPARMRTLGAPHSVGSDRALTKAR
jgi:hypothetical protein